MPIKHQLHSSTMKQRKTENTSGKWTILIRVLHDVSVHVSSLIILCSNNNLKKIVLSFSRHNEEFHALGTPFNQLVRPPDYMVTTYIFWALSSTYNCICNIHKHTDTQSYCKNQFLHGWLSVMKSYILWEYQRSLSSAGWAWAPACAPPAHRQQSKENPDDGNGT